MKKSKLIFIQIGVLFILVAVMLSFFFAIPARTFFNRQYLYATSLFFLFLLFIAFSAALIVSSLIKGHYVKSVFQNFFVWTIPISLLIGVYMVYDWQMGIKYRYREQNIVHNEEYKNFYYDTRDENIRMVIDAVEKKIEHKGDYRIIRMRVLEKDSIIKGKSYQYFDVQQMYYIGKSYNFDNIYFARHNVLDKKLSTVNVHVPFTSNIVKEQVSAIDSLVQRMASNLTLESFQNVSKNIANEVIKLKE